MKGPFVVIFLDYFNIIHTYQVLAQTSEGAIKIVENLYGYPIREIVDVYFDIDYMLSHHLSWYQTGEVDYTI